MIVQLYLAHYKSVAEDTIKLGAVNVFVGKNGSGKSNIIDALLFLSDVASDDLDYAITKRHGADSVRQWSKFKPYHTTIAVKISNEEGEGTYKIIFSSSRNGYRIVEEHFSWSGSNYFDTGAYTSELSRNSSGSLTLRSDYLETNDAGEVTNLAPGELASLRSDATESILHKMANRYYDEIYDLFGYLIRELKPFALFAIFPNTIRAPQSVSRSSELENDGKNIASVIKQMTGTSKKNRDRIIKSLRAVLPQLQNIAVRSAAGYYVPVFVVSDSSEESHELNMSQISDGTLRMLGILTALHQPNAPKKIAIEEPEQMIHPALLTVVRDAAHEFVRGDENRQVFLTTHSSELMDLFDVDDIVAVEYFNGSTRSGKISNRQREVVKSGLMTLGDLVLAEDLELA